MNWEKWWNGTGLQEKGEESEVDLESRLKGVFDYVISREVKLEKLSVGMSRRFVCDWGWCVWVWMDCSWKKGGARRDEG
jgi:hypothetical protein